MRSLRAGAKLSAAVALTLILVLGLPRIAAAQNAGAADPPLNFATNYFVTGDYVAAGARGLNASMGSDGFGTGIISFPDGNPGIRGATTVPKGASIVGAILYWQTVEKTMQFGSGQNGFFRPVFKGGPAKGYPISGFNVPNQNATSFSNGGCSGISTGKAVRTYRADVRGYLPVDSNGNVLANSADGVTFEVRLPNVGLNTPYTLGATLVLVFRVLNSPNYPLNVITIYDGSFAPNTMPGPPFPMSQSIQGFYQAANSPVSKLTHIVGAGKSNKFQQAYLGGGQGGVQRAATALPSPYGNNQPDFPGHYINWDTITWVFPDPTFPGHPNLANPLQENDDTATAMVVASGANPGCVSWGATIVSTTVHDDEKDGILQVWKQNQGYTDVATGLPVSLADPADPINIGHPRQDVFIQLDHVVDANGDFTPNPLGEVKMVHDAFLAHNVHLHFTDASQTTGIAGANAIQEPALTDGSQGCLGGLCPYPNQVGITTWRDGFEFVKNQPLNYNTEAECELNTPPFAPISNTNCIRRFPIQQRLSHHYVIWGDTLGGVNWTFFGGRLTDSTGTAGPGAGVVAQTSANTVTFYTTRGHGLTVDPIAGNGRVTVANTITNPSLNETHLVTSVTCPVNPDTIPPTGLGDCSVSNRALGPYSFTISVAGNAGAKYTAETDPYLSVESGQAGSGSGFSDVGGAGTLVTLGQWGPQATLHAKAGTFMHEIGHTLGLLHGGGDTTNCKSNYQSVMNYMFQAHLLGPGAVLDFSNQQLSTLDETSLGPITAPNGFAVPYGVPYTKWYDTPTLDFKVATITSFGITSNVVTFQAANTFKAGDKVQITGLTTGTYLNGQVFTVFSVGLSNTQFEASFANADVASTADSGTAKTTMPVPIGDVADHHCDGTPLTINDPAMSKYAGGTTLSPDVLAIPWSAPSLDANFEGGNPGSEAKFLGYSDWANADFRQVGAGGNEYFSVPGAAIPGGPGGNIPGGPGPIIPGGPGGNIPGGPGGNIPGGPGGNIPGGPGGNIPGGPGAAIPGGPGIQGVNGRGDLDFATAVSTIDPPSGLTALEAVSPRTIVLNWNTVTFPLIAKYNIYRSANQGATFSFLKSVAGPPAQDNVICNPGGYQYFVTAVFNNTAQITSFSITSNVVTFHATNNFTAGTVVQIAGLTTGTYLNGQALTVLSTGLSSTQFEASFAHANVASAADSGTAVSTKESARSNIVSTGQNGGLLTGCYTSPGAPTSFIAAPSVLPNAVHGTIVSVTFTVLTDFNTTDTPVNTTDNSALVTLVAIGPGLLANGCGTVGPTALLNNGQLTAALSGSTSTFPASSGGNYTLNWDTDGFCAGSYTFKLTLDSTQTQTSSPLLLSIDVTDRDNPHVSTTALPAGTVGVAYNNTVTEDGGTSPFKWTFAGSLPPGPPGTGISQQSQYSPTLSGTTCAAGPYNFTAMVTDANSNSGMQALTLQINKANSTTSVVSSANPSVFQQMVTFTVTVAQQPQSVCTPTGTVTLSEGGNALPGASSLALNASGMATYTTSALSVGIHNITVSYSGDLNFNPSNSALVQTVNKASTAITISPVLPSPAFVGQPITVAYNLSVVPPGAGTPIGPSGTVTVMASDGSSCSVPAVLGPGACVLSPIPSTAGNITFTVTYSGDNNFVMSAANGNYTVFIFVSASQPPANPPFTATTTLTNAVVGSPYSNTVYESGGVTTGPNNFSWTIVSGSVLPGNGSTLPGLSFQPNAVGVTNGTLSGTPTSSGTFTFTAMVTDSAGNTGTQNLTITVLAPAPAPFGLVSWYPFEGNANDLEKINNGNAVGTPQFVPAKVDNGFKPGPQPNGNIITIPDSPTLALTQFTIGAWVRVDALDNVETMQIVWKGDNTAGDLTTPYSLSVLGSANSNFSGTATVVGTPGPGKVLVILTDGSGTHELDLLSTNALSLGTFHYVAVTADGQKVNLFIDGVLDGNSPASESSLTGLPFTNSNPLQIGGVRGGPAPGNNFDGVIDEMQIWNRVLTPGEISGIFNTVGEFQPVARPAGLVSWWPAEGSYTDIINGNNGTPSVGVGFAPGEVGQAFSFNGVNGQIQVADNANLDVSQITIEAWVNPRSSGQGRPILQKRSSSNVGGYTFETTNSPAGPANGLQFVIWIGGVQQTLQTPANALALNAWQHVAATFDGSTMTIYVNAVQQASLAVSGSIDPDSTDPLVMGLNVFNGSDWDGFTDEVSLYNRALTSAEIQSIVNAGGAGKTKP